MKSMMEDSSLVTGWGFRCGWLVSIAGSVDAPLPCGSRFIGDPAAAGQVTASAHLPKRLGPRIAGRGPAVLVVAGETTQVARGLGGSDSDVVPARTGCQIQRHDLLRPRRERHRLVLPANIRIRDTAGHGHRAPVGHDHLDPSRTDDLTNTRFERIVRDTTHGGEVPVGTKNP